jgi:hypothetical protein
MNIRADDAAKTMEANGKMVARHAVPYTPLSFKTALLGLIIANDLVRQRNHIHCLFSTNLSVVIFIQSLNIIESPEFRTLLLMLRETLTEHDIPHCTALRSLVAKAWENQFAEMSVELKV